MKRYMLMLSTALLLSACATGSNEPGAIVAEDRFTQLVVPGRTTRAELLAASGAGRHTELVLLLDREGVVRKIRRRPPYPTDPQR
jgi:hypothetical protein